MYPARLRVLATHSTEAAIRAQPRPAWLTLAMISHKAMVMAQIATDEMIPACTAEDSCAALSFGSAACSRLRACPVVSSVMIRASPDRTAPAYISQTA